jgi:hypothetical protein
LPHGQAALIAGGHHQDSTAHFRKFKRGGKSRMILRIVTQDCETKIDKPSPGRDSFPNGVC